MEFVYCIADICTVVTRLLAMYMAPTYNCSGFPYIKLYHVKKTKKINHSNNKLKRQKLTNIWQFFDQLVCLTIVQND